MKRLLVLCPNVWDRQGVAHPSVAGDCEAVFAGAELLENPSIWTALTFNVFRYAEGLTELARAQRVDGVIGTGDYPGCMLAALVSSALGMPGAPPREVTLLSHKLYSRQIQQRAAPAETPRFWPVNPYALPEDLAFPVFVKPVKGTMSIRARHVASRAELKEAVHFTLRDRVRLHLLMRPFQQLLDRYSDGRVAAHHFIAEEPLRGDQVTVDGFVQRRQVTIMGIVDSVMYPGTQNFERFEYPSRFPADVQRRMAELVRKVMAESGLDHSCFNVELFYDRDRDALSIIEINPRMSYQFADLYERVDGLHTYAVQRALALGEPLSWRPGNGRHRAAASFVMRRFSDARVLQEPSEPELRRAQELLPGVSVKPMAHTGERLSDYDQDVGSFRYCIVNMSAPTPELLHQGYSELKRIITWRFDAPDPAAPAPLAERGAPQQQAI